MPSLQRGTCLPRPPSLRAGVGLTGPPRACPRYAHLVAPPPVPFLILAHLHQALHSPPTPLFWSSCCPDFPPDGLSSWKETRRKRSEEWLVPSSSQGASGTARLLWCDLVLLEDLFFGLRTNVNIWMEKSHSEEGGQRHFTRDPHRASSPIRNQEPVTPWEST